MIPDQNKEDIRNRRMGYKGYSKQKEQHEQVPPSLERLLCTASCSIDGNAGCECGMGLDWNNQETECQKRVYCQI